LGKLPTSIPGLDGILSGGIPELSIKIITCPPGTGKTIFTQQILYSKTFGFFSMLHAPCPITHLPIPFPLLVA
jgi:archaellum biogenesis ATPase FlaH